MDNTAPILFIIFNRPDETRRVFEEIRKARPAKLFIAADGPRDNRPGEKERCEEVQNIVRNVDWPCEVKTRFQETNLGCKAHVGSAIDWFFEHVEEGIILEDDCLPHPSFFSFVREMLIKYRNDKKIMMISGDNLEPEFVFSTQYLFSRYAHIWGWATWKRAWSAYDIDIKSYPSFKKSREIEKVVTSSPAQKFWLTLFDNIHAGKIDTWDAQWQYALFKEGGLSIIPATNLISNIGFGEDATHTKEVDRFANLATNTLPHLPRPSNIKIDQDWDALEERRLGKSLFKRIFDKIKRLI